MWSLMHYLVGEKDDVGRNRGGWAIGNHESIRYVVPVDFSMTEIHILLWGGKQLEKDLKYLPPMMIRQDGVSFHCTMNLAL